MSLVGGVSEYNNAQGVASGAAMNAGSGAGAGVTPVQGQYGEGAAGATGDCMDMTAQGASNSWDAFGGAPYGQNKEFHPGYGKPNQGHPEGPGPAPGRMYSGSTTGAPSGNVPQRLP